MSDVVSVAVEACFDEVVKTERNFLRNDSDRLGADSGVRWTGDEGNRKRQ